MKKFIRTASLSAVVLSTTGMAMASVSGTCPVPRPPHSATMTVISTLFALFGV